MRAAAGGLALFLAVGASAWAADGRDALVSEAVSKKTFVFGEFVSKTCPACEEMRPVVAAVLRRFRNIVRRVHDADVDAELAKAYEVRCVPVYVVIDPKGEVRFNEVGVRTEEELEEILRTAGVRSR